MAVASRHSYRQRRGAGGKPFCFRRLWMVRRKAVMFSQQLAAPSLRRLRRHLATPPRAVWRLNFNLPGNVPANQNSAAACIAPARWRHGRLRRPPKSQPKADDRRRLRRRRNPLPRRREETPEAAEGGGGNLLFCSGLLLLQMTGRNRHLQKKGLGGKETAYPLKLKWMRWSRFAARRVDVSVRPATKPSGEAPGGFNLPPQKGDKIRFPGELRARKGGRMRRFHRGSKFRQSLEGVKGRSPCRFFSIFLFDKRNMGPAAA